MKRLGIVLWFIAVGAFIIGWDYFMDVPSWFYFPEIWECPGESAGFQFCTP